MRHSDRSLSIFILLLLALVLTPGLASGTTIALTPASAAAQVGDLLSVTVRADAVQNLAGFQARIGFDPALLEVVSVSVGNGFDRTVKKSYTNLTGQASLAAVTISSPTLGGQNLLLGTIDFKVKGTGTVDIVLSETLLGDSSGEEIPATVANSRISAVPPTIAITSPAPGYVTTATPLLVYSVSSSAVTVRIDGNPVDVASGQFLPKLTEGTHTLSVEVNGTGISQSVTFTVDTVPPDIAISAKPANPVNAAVGSFTFASTDPTATLECRLDTVDFSSCTSPYAFTSLAEGNHYFEVRAVDKAGNSSPAPAHSGWVIDLTPPSVVSTSPGPAASEVPVSSPVSVVFSEGINQATLTPSTFSLAGVSGKITYDPASKTALFTPAAPLAAATGYSAMITTGVSDLAGNALSGAISWNFTTIANLLPIKMITPTAGLYSTILELLSGSLSGNVSILAQTCTLKGDHRFRENAVLTIDGGYDDSFTSHNGYTVIEGVLGIEKGSLAAGYLIVK